MEGLACLGLGIERPSPALFQALARAFQKHHGLDESAAKFFDVHTMAIVKHSQLAARIVAELAQTEAQQAGAREVLVRVWDLQKRQLVSCIIKGAHRPGEQRVRPVCFRLSLRKFCDSKLVSILARLSLSLQGPFRWESIRANPVKARGSSALRIAED
jgi:hypothetical protein